MDVFFRPPLKCNSQALTNQFSTGYVSKLMEFPSFKKEISEVQGISKILEHKDETWAKKYFVIPLEKDGCNMNITDKTNEQFIIASNNVVEPCQYKWSDIKTNPMSYKLSNQVDGGVDLEDVLNSNKSLSSSDFTVINNVLIDLLLNGIYEMNKLGIYHFDIKTSNIVYNVAEGQMRLIDWGFTRVIHANKIKTEGDMNSVIRKLPVPGILYYGAHYGNALLMDDFDDWNTKVNTRVRGVVMPLTRIFKELITNDETSYMGLYDYYDRTTINNRLVNNYKFIVQQPKIDYFKTVFLPNSDIFAFLFIYLKLQSVVTSSKIKDNIDKLIDTYMLQPTYSNTPYNIGKLVYSLQNLANINPYSDTPPAGWNIPTRSVSPEKYFTPDTLRSPISPRLGQGIGRRGSRRKTRRQRRKKIIQTLLIILILILYMVHSNKKGGEFVQKGTYGCVFRPPLKCLNPSSGIFRRRFKVDLNAKFKEGYVSKLMTDDNFNNELYEVIAISNALKLQRADSAWQNKYLVLPLYEDGCVIDINNKDNIQDIDESNWPHPDPKKQRSNCNFTVDDIKKKVKNYRILNQVDWE